MPAAITRPSFAAGEVSPAFYGRVDVAKYASGLRSCRNMVVQPQGGVSRRRGTYYLGAVQGPGRLIRFRFSASIEYMLVFTDYRMEIITTEGAFVGNYVDLVNADRWTWASTTYGGNPAYYLTTQGGTDPELTEPTTVKYASTSITKIFGDYDTLGFDTIYVMESEVGSVDPDTLSIGAITGYWASPATLQVTTPYAVADLPLLKYCQSADTMFLTHPDYPPYKLERYSPYTWLFTQLTFVSPAAPPVGLTATLQGTAGATTRTMAYAVTSVNAEGDESLLGEQVNCVVNQPWDSGEWVDLAWNAVTAAEEYRVYKNSRGVWGQIAAIVSGLSNAPANGGTPVSGGDYSTYVKAKAFDADIDSQWIASQSGVGASGVAYIGLDYGAGVTETVTGFRIRQHRYYGTGSVKLEHSPDGTTWTTLETFSLLATDDWQEFTITVASAVRRYWRLLCNATPDFSCWQVAELRFCVSGTSTAFEDDNISPNTSVGPPQQVELFEAASDYPGTCSIHQQRLWLARTDNQPATVWASRTGSFQNFGLSLPLRADDSIEATIAALQVDEIRAIVPLRELIVFTAGSVWSVTAGGELAALTPTSISMIPQTYVGANHMPPLTIGNSVLYVVRNADEVRDLHYDIAADAQTGANMSILAGHLFTSDLTGWTHTATPDGIVWCVRDDGVLLGFTFLAEHDVYAWHRHDLGAGTSGATGAAMTASVEAVGSMDPNGHREDYFLAKRTLPDASTVYYVEFVSWVWAYQDSVFLDSFVLAANAVGGQTLAGLDHLEGMVVTAVLTSDGSVETHTVTGGEITITGTHGGAYVHVGLPFTSYVETLDLELDPTVQGKRKKIHAVNLKLKETRAVELGQAVDAMSSIYLGTGEVGAVGSYKDGDQRLPVPPAWNTHGRLCIGTTTPHALTILAITPEVSVGK